MGDCEKAEQIVYISCLDEVRYSFVSHLSEALRRIRAIKEVFEDSDDLLSEEAQGIVERARVSVMVLPGSREPAAASACLGKLRKVIDCQKKDDQVVVPVLYGVREIEREWLNELEEITGLSPYHHRSRKECSDSKLVKEIVRDVYEKLFYMGQIGIYSKLMEIENMVFKKPLGIRCVGIWGMPGIGKTTLAKAVFNQMAGEFDAYCFIENYEKVFHEKGLYGLLEEHFLKEEHGAGGTITKMSLLRKRLNNKRVLVVLDDVRNPLVAESFLGGFDWFGSKSLIIITSRDKQVFRLCRVNQIYEVQGLNEKEALQLFMMCASITSMGEQNLHELLMEVIGYANGNPLALRIYGDELKGKKTLTEMETAFLELKEQPPYKFVDAIRSSYDSLNDIEKNIFLDIACFFQGENVDYVMPLLEGCGFFPHVGIDVLIEKCLVTISDNRIRMPNLTQDVGREIILKGETVQIEKSSRLWEPQSIKDLLEDNEDSENGEPKSNAKCAQGTEYVEGIFLDTLYSIFDLKPAAFENMANLRLLKIYCSDPEIRPVINFRKGFIHSLPNELRLLHWENYPLQSLPQSFDPMHLVEINMPHSQLQKLWGGTKKLEMLRTIKLCHSQQLVDIDDLLQAQNVEVVDLRGCTKLQSFPATCQLLLLRVVNLSGCTEIKSLAEVPPNVEALHLQGTGITELPLSTVKPSYRELVNILTDISGLPGVSNLEQIDLERLTSLMKMSLSCKNLSKLICLDLKDCSHLQSLPNMANFEFLKVLDLSGCSELETIQGFPQNLKELYIAGTSVREVPPLPQSLELLYAHGCVSLKSICLDSENLPMHYTFSNCFNLSPLVVNEFLVKVLGNVKHIPREHPQELNEVPAFSFCAPLHTNQDSTTLDLQPGSSVMTQLNPSSKSTLVGFAMIVEVAFLEDYYDATGFGISCVCRWKNKEGHSHRIERNLHCWAAGKAAPKLQKDHMFVFCDAKMRPSTSEGNDHNILADLVVFEFFPVNMQKQRLDDTCTVTRCGVYVIPAQARNTSLEDISPVLSWDQMELYGNEDEEVLSVSYESIGNSSPESSSTTLSMETMDFPGNWIEQVFRDIYDGLHEIDKALFLYIACLFNDEDFDLVEPLFACIDLDVSSGLEVLAQRSLIHLSSNGEILMRPLLRKLGKEILYRQSILPGSPKELTRGFEKDFVGSSSSHRWKHDVYLNFSRQDVIKLFCSRLLVAFEHESIITFKDNEMDRGNSSPLLVQAIRDSRISIVVLSKNYTSSSWLLNELVEIAKCSQELGTIVMTVFYDVDPLEVREQTGEFGRHFKQTCKGKTEDKKQQWQQALVDIANIAGEHSLSWEKEADMIEKIVTDVLNKLNGKLLTVYDDLVGIKAHIAKMIALLRLESDEVRMLGIWGPLGISKSTIASCLHREISSKFQGSAFVDASDGRRVRTDDYNVMLHFQRVVLSQILTKQDIRINRLGVMEETLRDQKVLITLDGVDDKLLLDAVAGNINWFGPGSRIIVITEDLGLLKSHGISDIYKVDLPSRKEALQMLGQCTFGQNSPPDGFMGLATEVAEIADNLPLGLIDSDSGGCKKGLWWYKDLGQHVCGDFSMAVVQANNLMEDQSQLESGPYGTFVGVYDGHGGPETSRFINDHMFHHLKRFAAEQQCMSPEVIKKAFQATEEGFLSVVTNQFPTRPQIATVGSCCLVSVICDGTLYVANVGDSRAVLGQVMRATGEADANQLSEDHNVAIESVRREVQALHPDHPDIVVLRHGVWRVKGIIQVSRSIGDVCLKRSEFNTTPLQAKFRLRAPFTKPFLSAEPAIKVHTLQAHDQFIICASDGLWEHMSNQEAVDIVMSHPRNGIAKRLVKVALQEAAKKREMKYSHLEKIERGVRRHFHDDITVIVVFFDTSQVSKAGLLRGRGAGIGRSMRSTISRLWKSSRSTNI